ncbi:HpcH/HpaI aldolase family protein [Salinithrix halophila]|uniref:HpcH/HpaI aldolase/citrate lyase family protein n=1 Tax=Salinithrix halophila TaxID=1485204 RepID=A0ABV8JBH7_9BACL
MRRNEMKRKLEVGEPVYGLFCTTPSPVHVEMVGHAGYDFVILDTEHTLVNPETLEHMIRAAEAVSLTPLVRVPEADPGAILRSLDAGAQGVVVPHVRRREDLEAALHAARYFPEGMRSLNGGRVPGFFGEVSPQEYVKRANEETMVIPMIEDREGVEGIDEILSIPGISGVLEGAADLSQSLGIPWETRHPEVREAVMKVKEAANRHGVPFFALPRVPEDLGAWRKAGVHAFVLGEERSLAFRALHNHLRAHQTHLPNKEGAR